MWKKIAKFLKAFNSNRDPGVIAAGFSAGILLGFMPKNNVLWYILCIFIFFLRIQKPAYVLSMLVASMLAFSLDPIFDSIGYAVLTWEKAIPLYTQLLNTPFISFTKFNNTIVMGSLVSGIVLFVPLYFLFRLFILLWRKYIAQAIKKSKIQVIISKIPLVSKIRDAYDAIEME